MMNLWFCAVCSTAQNHTSITRRNNNENQLDEHQIKVFAQLLDNMVFVDGGSFYMGVEDQEDDDCKDATRHWVSIDPFFMSRFEVTQELWTTVMDYNPAQFQHPEKPVENVSWEETHVFINKLNQLTGMDFRLPTEAEWEFAARGGTNSLDYQFAGSDFPSAVAWFEQNSECNTHIVGTKRPNELGIFDMSGNVAEWCQDLYQHDYYKNSPTNNPKGPQQGYNRVNRGGSWINEHKYARVFHRNLDTTQTKSPSIGFRLAM